MEGGKLWCLMWKTMFWLIHNLEVLGITTMVAMNTVEEVVGVSH